MKRHWILMLFACLLITSCGSQAEPKRDATPAATQSPAAPATPAAAATAAAPDRTEYPLKGTVVSVEKYSDRLTVKHEAIPGFMGAMTMPYTVKGANALENVSPGDEITAKVISSGGGYWLQDIVVTKKAAPAK